jgi:hypothetical protein
VTLSWFARSQENKRKIVELRSHLLTRLLEDEDLFARRIGSHIVDLNNLFPAVCIMIETSEEFCDEEAIAKYGNLPHESR